MYCWTRFCKSVCLVIAFSGVMFLHRLKEWEFRFFNFRFAGHFSNSSAVKFDSSKSLLEFKEPGTLIELPGEDEDLLCLYFRSLRCSRLSLGAFLVIARWCLACIWYLLSSDVRDEDDGDSENVQALSVIFFFFPVSSTWPFKFFWKKLRNRLHKVCRV